MTTPPKAEEYGWQVLGSIIEKGELIERADLFPEDFYWDKDKVIFRVMQDMARSEIPIDILTLNVEIKKAGKEEITGGFSYLSYLTEITISTVNFDWYVKEVKQYSRRCKQKELCLKMQQDVEKGEDERYSEHKARLDELDAAGDDSRLKPVSARDLPDEETVESLWGGIFYPNIIVQINSEPGVGKTTLLYNLFGNGAKGGSFLGIPFSKPIKTLYVDLETPKWLRKVKLKRILGDGDLQETLHFIDDLDFSRDSKGLLALCKREKYDVVIFDTQSRVLAMEQENDNAEANRLLAPMRRLTNQAGCCLVLVHHKGKSENAKGVYGGRGASAFAGGVEVVVNLEALDKDVLKLGGGKNRILGSNPVLYLKKSGEDLFEPYTPPGESSGFEIFKAQDCILNLLGDGGDMRTSEISEKVETQGFPRRTTERALRRLTESGKIIRIKQGFYTFRHSDNNHTPMLGGSVGMAETPDRIKVEDKTPLYLLDSEATND